MVGGEVALQRAPQAEAHVEARRVDAAGVAEVARRLGRIQHRERRVRRVEEAGVLAGTADGDVAGQRARVARERDDRAERRVVDAALRRVAGVHQVARAIVVAFLAGQRADQRHALHLLRQARQVLGDADAPDVGLDRLERPAGRAARLGIEGVELARPALHVEQDAGARVRRLLLRAGGAFGERAALAAERQPEPERQRGAHAQLEKPAAGDRIARAAHECLLSFTRYLNARSSMRAAQ